MFGSSSSKPWWSSTKPLNLGSGVTYCPPDAHGYLRGVGVVFSKDQGHLRVKSVSVQHKPGLLIWFIGNFWQPFFYLRTRTINKCFNLPEGDVECLDTPVEKLIKVTSQVCDGEKYIQKCFKIGVARCYESSVMILISALIHNSIAIEDMAQIALQR